MNDKIHFPVEPRHKIKGILMTRDKNAKHKNPYHGKGRSLIGLIREKNHMKVKDHPFFEMSKKTNFANVDLDIYTRSPLESLAAAFGKKVILHYAFELCIQTRTLEAVVQVNGRIGITIYAAQV